MKTVLHTSVRAKTAAIVIFTILLVNISVYIVAQSLILQSYETIEHDMVVQNIKRTEDAIENYSKGLHIKIKDWALWDDSYEFALHPKTSNFIEETLNQNSLTELLELNLVIYTDIHGSVLYTQATNLTDGSDIPAESIVQNVVNTQGVLMSASSTPDSVTRGIIPLPEGPLLVVSVPIFPTNPQGTPSGTLIFGRFMNEAFMHSISELTHLSITDFPLESSDTPPDVRLARAQLTEEQRSFVQPLSKNAIAGYTTLYTLNNTPAVTLRIDSPRDVYNQGETTLIWFLISTTTFLIVFGVVAMLLAERYVVARLTKLTREVLTIGTTHNLSARVDAHTTDEIGILAGAINNMLTDLWQSQQKQEELDTLEKVASQNLKERLEEIERMNKIMTGREMKMIELKETITKLRARLGEPDTD